MAPHHRLIRWLFFVTIGAYLAYPFLDPAVYSGLTVGRWIAAHHRVPLRDLWQGGGYFADTWLGDLLLASVHRHLGGDLAVALFHLSLSVLFVVLLGERVRRASSEPFFSAIITLLVAVAVLTADVPPQHLLAWCVFLLLVWVPERLLAAGQEKERRLPWFGAALLWVVGANTAFSAAVAAAFFAAVRQRLVTRAASPLLTVVSCAALLCTPHLVGVVQGAYEGLFSEVEPSVVTSFRYGLLLVLVVLGVVLLKSVKVSLERRIVWGGVFLASALFAARWSAAAPYVILSLGVLLGEVWRGVNHADPLPQGVAKLQRALSQVPAAGVVWLFLCVIVVNAVRIFRDPAAFSAVPTRAIEFLRGELVRTPAAAVPTVVTDPFVVPALMHLLSDERGEPQVISRAVPAELAREQSVAELQKFELTAAVREAVQGGSPTAVLCREASALCRGSQLLGWGEAYRYGNWRVLRQPR